LVLVLSFFLGPALVFGQGEGFAGIFDKAPPHIDQALREKVTFFFDRFKEGKYRQADQVVHEDSKDDYFLADKFKVRNFKILNIIYQENYTRARVVIDLGTEYHFPGFKKIDVNVAWVSFWKLDQDQWWWHTLKGKERETAFGILEPGPDGKGQEHPKIEDLIDKAFEKGKALPDQVKIDRTQVTLSSHEPSDEYLQIKNEFEGPVKLQLAYPDMAGLIVALDKTDLPVGETAKLRIGYRPPNSVLKPDMEVAVFVPEVGKRITIAVKFALPPAQKPAAKQ